jgi:beta-glucosidase
MKQRSLLGGLIWPVLVIVWIGLALPSVWAQRPRPPEKEAPKGPWMDKSLSPDQRADLLIKQMTLDEKISLLHGGGRGFTPPGIPPPPTRSLGGAGFIPGIERLGTPDLQMADAAVGVTRGAGHSRYSTLMPSGTAEASSWDPKLAYEYGSLIGRELRAQGYTMSLGGGVNITREPRNGRNFEYKGEDPILAGTLVGQEMKGLQAQGVIGDIKHYALNDQETGRNIGNVILDKRSMRETDLLAFEIGIRDSGVGAVMCSYNKISGDFACENQYTLNEVLKKNFNFKGFVLSDWGGTHSTTKAALAGLDMEMPGHDFFGDNLKKAVQSGEVPMSRLDDMVHRILRTEFVVGLFDNPQYRMVVDVFGGLSVAQHAAEEGIVVLKNADHLLPLSSTSVKSIAIIGSHADVGVLSGGGSAQVDPPGGNAAPPPGTPPWAEGWQMAVYFPSSPLKAIHAKLSNAKVEFNDGSDPAAAAALAKSSDVAIVFANQPTSEGRDEPSLSLPNNQDALVSAVAEANSHTIVVLETGGPVSMPWVNNVGGIVEMWYPGIRGAEALANILFGTVNPSGKLPVTFAASDADLPHKTVFEQPPMSPPPPGEPVRHWRMNNNPFDITYDEGLKVGYKWYDAEDKEPLFPFGFGLSYTTFDYSGLEAKPGQAMEVTFTVKNTGARAGTEIAQVYASLPKSTNEPPKRLIGWTRIELAPGESKTVTVSVEPLFLSIFNVDKDGWELVPGDYRVWVGGSSRDTPLNTNVRLGGK